jgi:DNA polymerase
MHAHMPRKYWRNMPETQVIDDLIARAPIATATMIESAPTHARLRAPPRRAPTQLTSGLTQLRNDAQRCTACPLYAKATQTVCGEGAETAAVMFVGEQPGDQEDLVGRPFVGPAGQLFDRALLEAGIDRRQTYVTNAVKHFKFEPRGKRRLHKTPGQLEIEACHHWLEQEISHVGPRLIVALGATATHALLRRPTPVQRNRGRVLPFLAETELLITVHPSYLLRVADEQQPEEYLRFVADLRLAVPFIARVPVP